MSSDNRKPLVYISGHRAGSIQDLMLSGALSTICEILDEPPASTVFELKCPEYMEEPEFIIPPKRAVPHYRELEVSKKKGKRRNY